MNRVSRRRFLGQAAGSAAAVALGTRVTFPERARAVEGDAEYFVGFHNWMKEASK